MCCKENLCELRRQVYFFNCSYKRPSIYNIILERRGGGGPNILQYYMAPCSQPCAVGSSFGRSKFTIVKLWENLHSWLDGSGGSCGSVASDGSGWSGGLMSLLGLFGLVDLVCQLVWYFFGYFIAPKRIFKWKYCPKWISKWIGWSPSLCWAKVISNESMDSVDSKVI